MVENIDGFPLPPVREGEVPPAPPAPTVIGKPVAETVTVAAPSIGLAVYGVVGLLCSLNPPAPPPPPTS